MHVVDQTIFLHQVSMGNGVSVNLTDTYTQVTHSPDILSGPGACCAALCNTKAGLSDRLIVDVNQM